MQVKTCIHEWNNGPLNIHLGTFRFKLYTKVCPLYIINYLKLVLQVHMNCCMILSSWSKNNYTDASSMYAWVCANVCTGYGSLNSTYHEIKTMHFNRQH